MALRVVLVRATLLAASIGLAACDPPDHHSWKLEEPSKNELALTKILSVDGCDVYRFYDQGYFRYFSACSGSVSWTTMRKSGKTTITEPDSISTRVFCVTGSGTEVPCYPGQGD